MLPAWVAQHLGGMTIVVVPLIALQVELKGRCEAAGIPCVEWESHRHPDHTSLVFVTPEAVHTDEFQSFLNRKRDAMRLDRIVVNECHLMLNTSETFRPVLQQLGRMHQFGAQMVFLTATLPPKRGEPTDPADAAYLVYEAAGMRDLLNEEQLAVFHDVVSAVLDSRPAAWYLQGPGGTGKIFLYRAIYAELRRLGCDVICVASSGIAATLLPSGTTAHSQFGIPLQLHEDSTSALRPRTSKFRRLASASLIIWDEVPMRDRHAVELVDRLCQDARDNRSLFGGLPVLMGGDFAQTLPIVAPSTRTRTVAACLQRSLIWPQLAVRQLYRNMRLPPSGVNADYARYLSTMSYREELQGTITLPPYIPRSETAEDLCNAVYPDTVLSAAARDPDVFAERSIITIRNDAVTGFNDRLIARMPGRSRKYYSADRAQEGPGPRQRSSHADRARSGRRDSATAPASSSPGCIMYDWNITARIIAGDFKGAEHTMPLVPLETTEGQLSFTLHCVQFPIRLCFAMTINKSQGQSLKRVGVDLRVPAFSHGQLYVALSRVTDVGNLSVLHIEGSDAMENVVFPEVVERFQSPTT
ncbi:hypothetical protein N7535_002843 [Penicillium sp. DV-2018c]|nr:hypothetical protein N7461_001473 [Penicillium sp. DV-2018c]KAJ5575917.1 hypothetical protein N7535_002843 [Penicillium sp. DV-2018c]